MRRVGSSLGISALFVLLLGASAFSDPAVVTYTPTDAIFPNPERGFLHAERTHSWGYTPLDLAALQGYRQDGVSLIKRVFYLDNFVPNYYNLPPWPWPEGYDFLATNPGYPAYDENNGVAVPISAIYIANMEADFSTLRAAGLKAVVRFAYTNKRFEPPFEDADLEEVLAHLDQLQPILQANSDVIALVEAGFIGNWGEWFYTDHFIEEPRDLSGSPFAPESITADDYANRGAVVSKILEVLPDHMVQLRTPFYKYQIYDSPDPYNAPRSLPTPLDVGNAHGGSDLARTGHHNDCFLGNDTDAGTYGFWVSVADDKDYLEAESNYVPVGGEVCNPGGGGPTRFDCTNTLAELQQFHWSYLNVETGAEGSEVYAGWGTGGCLDQIKQKLGYRFTLVEGTYADVVEPGATFAISIQLRNDGWAAPYNPRPVELVLRHTVTGDVHTVALDEDPRFWMPGDTQTLDHTIQADVPAGAYDLLLHLPDRDPSLADRPEYAVRFANEGVWEEGTGYNDLGHALQVSPEGAAPVVSEITAAVDPVQVASEVDASASFTDQNVIDTHTALWDWGDESTSDGVITEENGSGSVAGSHVYDIAGVYTVTLTVTDDGGMSSSSTFHYVVAFDPDGGFVTGGGWILSPAGAYASDPSLTGKANFGFNSKYKKGATTPTGQTQFSFKVADLKFKSTEYQWLVIAGPHAKFKGSGTINGEGDYGFMLTATDGQVNGGGGTDRFRIKIWDRPTDQIVYDNQVGDDDDADATHEIGGGSIVIHQGSASKPTLAGGSGVFPNVPNPFNPSTHIAYQLGEPGEVTLVVYNLLGQPVRVLVREQQEAGYYQVTWDGRDVQGRPVSSGVYLYRFVSGSFVQTNRMLLLK